MSRFIVHHFLTAGGVINHEAGEASSIEELGQSVCPKYAADLVAAAEKMEPAETIKFWYGDYYFESFPVSGHGRPYRSRVFEATVAIHRIS